MASNLLDVVEDPDQLCSREVDFVADSWTSALIVSLSGQFLSHLSQNSTRVQYLDVSGVLTIFVVLRVEAVQQYLNVGVLVLDVLVNICYLIRYAFQPLIVA